MRTPPRQFRYGQSRCGWLILILNLQRTSTVRRFQLPATGESWERRVLLEGCLGGSNDFAFRSVPGHFA
jgi:hypothetical protein